MSTLPLLCASLGAAFAGGMALWRFRVHRSVARLSVHLSLAGFVAALAVAHGLVRPDGAGGHSSARLYLGTWSEAMRRPLVDWIGPTAREVDLYVTSPALATVTAALPAVRCHALDDPDEPARGLTTAAIAKDLLDAVNAHDVGPDTRVLVVAPRGRLPADWQAEQRTLVASLPWLAAAPFSFSTDAFGVREPVLSIEAPQTVTPTLEVVPVRLVADHVPTGGTVEFQVRGLLRGVPASQTRQSIGFDGKALVLGGARIEAIDGAGSWVGEVPAPQPNKTLVFEASVRDAFGQVLTVTRAVTVSEDPQVPFLHRKGRDDDPTYFENMLASNGISTRAVTLDLAPFADAAEEAKKLDGVNVLVVEVPLTRQEGQGLSSVLAASGAPPRLLFVGQDSQTDVLPEGWQRYVPALPDARGARMILFIADQSGSMDSSIGGAWTGRKLAKHVVEQLTAGIMRRNANALVACVDPRGGLCSPTDDWTGTQLHFELNEALREARKAMENHGHPVSDVVIFCDGEDWAGGGDQASVRDSVQWLTQRGVRLFPISINSPLPEELGPELHRADQACCRKDYGFDETGNEFTAAVAAILWQNCFPRLGVHVRGRGLDQLPNAAERRALAKYVRESAADFGLMTPLCAFTDTARIDGDPDVALTVAHWAQPNREAPLLRLHSVREGDRVVAVAHLAFDQVAERAIDGARPASRRDKSRRALAGLMVRVVSALADKLSDRPVAYAPLADGMRFWRRGGGMFRLDPGASPDWIECKDIGLGAAIERGSTLVPCPTTVDSISDLGLLDVHVRGLRDEADDVRFVVEHQQVALGEATEATQFEVERTIVTVPMWMPPPHLLDAGAPNVAGAAPAAGETTSMPWYAVPGRWAFATVLLGLSVLLVLVRVWA